MDAQVWVLWGPGKGEAWQASRRGGLAPAASCTYPAREGAFFLTVTFALYCFGKNASGTMHTVLVPTFQKRHQGVRKHSAKEQKEVRQHRRQECPHHPGSGRANGAANKPKWSSQILTFFFFPNPVLNLHYDNVEMRITWHLPFRWMLEF